MRWYSPRLKDFEWRQVPTSDEEAMALLANLPQSGIYVSVYQEWRAMRACILVSLIRAGEAAQGHKG